MQTATLLKFQNKIVDIVLKNNFTYSKIKFRITKDGLIEFIDRTGKSLTIEPEFISLVSEVPNGE